MSIVATILILGLIVGLLYLDRDPGEKMSWALWIPIIWIAIISSRPISMWLQINREVSMEDRYTEGSPLDATFYGLLILAAAYILNRRWPRLKMFLLANLPLLLFFLYCGLSAMWSDAPPVAAKRWVKALGDPLMLLVILTDPKPMMALKKVFSWVGFTLLPLSVLFIYAFPSIGTSFDPQIHVRYYSGVTTFKNLLGETCLFCGLGSLWIFVRTLEDRTMTHRTRHMVAHGIVFALAIALIKRADSMTSLSSTVLASLVVIGTATIWAKRKLWMPFALVTFAIGAATFAVFVDTAGSLLQSLGRNSTLTGRTMIWSAVLAQNSNPIIGTGFETFWMGDRMLNVWSLSQRGIEEAHNGYLEVYLNLGWVGIVLLVFLIVTGYRSASAQFRVDPHGARIRLGMFAAILIFVLTEAGFRMMSPSWFAFLLSIMAVPPVFDSGPTPAERQAQIGAEPRGWKILQ